MSEPEKPPEVRLHTGEFVRDPHPAFARLREQGRVHRETVSDCVLLSRYSDVDELLRRREYSKDPRKLPAGDPRRRALMVDPDRPPHLSFLDPPEHTRIRKLVSRFFAPAAIEVWRARIQELMDEVLGRLGTRRTFDLVEEVAQKLPILVIAEMLGVPEDDLDRFTQWSLEMVHLLNPFSLPAVRASALEASARLNDYFREAFAELRRVPRDNLMNAILTAEEGGERMTEVEQIDLCVLLLIAGNVTTTDLICNGMLALLQHPEQLRKLREEPGRIASAVEEILRYEPPFLSARRTALADADVAGCPFKGGTVFEGALASANRDPAVFAEPDEFDITRSENPHLAFGAGIHFCLGAHLARVEGQVALLTLVRRYPALHLDCREADLRWRRLFPFRSLTALPVATDSGPQEGADG